MFIFRLEWNLAALVGLLMLTGIVVTNGIVLVDKIESYPGGARDSMAYAPTAPFMESSLKI
ncbi:hypothetical protein LCY76_12330 [Fictibacillus sp. KIGAM418]|uniref:Efflux RND transporter permease subunit n=1 Tax=Fictibacillus marinisediminis TaxID=2878389 RepID=A0A9X2BD80_9BACL|nr:hypothetical protein [Fictibacillus marinisediminis]MCK6257381.1 hypothetical protein [Fictibacillus marinisediminis]